MDQPSLLLRPRAPEEGARLLALSYLDQAAAAFPRLKDLSDTEGLHDFRVALRRLRSCLRAYRSFLEESLSKKRQRRLRDLAQATGPSRDMEVQIEWLRAQGKNLAGSHRSGLSWILARFDERLQKARAELLERMDEDFPALEEDLRERLSVYHSEIRLGEEPRRPTFGEVTADILRAQAMELEEHLACVHRPEDEVEAHEARISAKRLRYLLEPVTDELPSAAPRVKRLKALQDILGDLHDAHVLETELHTAAVEASSDRAYRLFRVSVEGDPDAATLRAERRRVHENGLIALGRLNRVRRDRLFQKLEEGWLGGRSAEFLGELVEVAEALRSSPPAPLPQAGEG